MQRGKALGAIRACKECNDWSIPSFCAGSAASSGVGSYSHCLAALLTKVARAESGINTTCSLSALCSKPCGKSHWQKPLAPIPVLWQCQSLAVPQGSGSTEGGGLGTSVSPGAAKRKNKPHRISVLATKRSPAASLGSSRSVKQPRGCCLSSLCLTQGHPFPAVLEAAVEALLQQSIVQTQCCAAVPTSHTPTASKRRKKHPSKQTQSHGSSLSVGRFGARRKWVRG